MKINDSFILKEVAGNYVVIPVDDDVLDFNGVITVNEVGAIIWKGIEDGKSKKDIIDLIMKEYDIDEATVTKDIDEFVSNLAQKNIITE